MFLKKVKDASKWFSFWYSGYKFRGNNFYLDRVGYGFGSREDLMLEKVSRDDKEACIGLMNDYDLSLTRKLCDLGFHNLVLISTDREVDDMYRNHFYNLPTIQKAVSKSDVSSFWQKIVYIEEKELPTGKVNKKTGEIKTTKRWVVEGADNMKFKYIISNPPYAIGNQITRAIVDNVNFDTMVNLMPASKYKGGNLYEHVSELSSAEDTFEDAAVGDSLTLAVLKKDANVFESYDSLAITRMNPLCQDFYKLNMRVKAPYEYKHALKRVAVDELVVENSFLITMRTIQNGTHCTENCADYPYNINNCADNIPWDITHDCASCNFLIFNSAVEKINLSKFWYYNPLMNTLIKGLNASSGRMTIAIPNIDWSVERDYEHLTLEDIMTILREEA